MTYQNVGCKNVLALRLVDMLAEAIGYLPAETYIEMCTCPSSLDCNCRKPAPGMLLNIIKKSGIHPGNALYIGDLDKDYEAARRAHIRFMWAKISSNGSLEGSRTGPSRL